MEELKDNEARALKKLQKMAEKQNPVPISLRNFKVKIRKKQWYFKWRYWTGSHMAVKEIFQSLQRKGYITLDYSDKANPKVIVNTKGGGI